MDTFQKNSVFLVGILYHAYAPKHVVIHGFNLCLNQCRASISLFTCTHWVGVYYLFHLIFPKSIYFNEAHAPRVCKSKNIYFIHNPRYR
jgi:hypothetical protein